MTKTVARYTFRALNAEGQVIAQSRGRAGALEKVLRALLDYRNAVAAASGRLYGDPQRLGSYSVDGVTGLFGPAGWIHAADEVEWLDRLGLTRVAEICVSCRPAAA